VTRIASVRIEIPRDVKVEVVRRYHEEPQVTVTQLAKDAGVSTKSVHRWIKESWRYAPTSSALRVKVPVSSGDFHPEALSLATLRTTSFEPKAEVGTERSGVSTSNSVLAECTVPDCSIMLPSPCYPGFEDWFMMHIRKSHQEITV